MPRNEIIDIGRDGFTTSHIEEKTCSQQPKNKGRAEIPRLVEPDSSDTINVAVITSVE
jgi:hypothetical protein